MGGYRITVVCSLVYTAIIIAGPTNGDEHYGEFTGDIKPIIYVSDVQRSAPFYRDVLAFVFDGFAGNEADPYYAEMLAGPVKFGLHETTMSGDELRIGQQRLYFRVRDRDAIYGEAFRRQTAALGINETTTASRSPWQNPYAERVICSIRRECLDHTIVWVSATSNVSCRATSATTTLQERICPWKKVRRMEEQFSLLKRAA